MFKSKKKWQTLVDKLYPAASDADAGINSHQVSNLLHYASITPNKLPDIGKYLEKRAREDIRKNRVPFVAIAMETFKNLLSTCQQNMAFFAPNIIRVMMLLFDDPRPKLQCLATDTFIKFAECTQHVGGQQHDMDLFVEKFLGMATYLDRDEMNVKQMRIYGLRGLHAYVISKDDIESFVTRWLPTVDVNPQSNVLAAILSNMHFSPKEEAIKYSEIAFDKLDAQLTMVWSDASCRVPHTATLCLRDLVARLNNISIRPILTSFLCHLDTNDLWTPKEYAMHCVRTICNGIPQQRHLVQMSLLRHVSSESHGAVQRKSIIETLIVLMEGVMGPVIEILSSLLGLLIESAFSKEGNAPAEEQLQMAILDCISYATKSVDTIQRMDAMTYILHRFREVDHEHRTAAQEDTATDDMSEDDDDAERGREKAPKDTGGSNVQHALRMVARSVFVVSELLQPLPANRAFPASLAFEVIQVMSHTDAVVRVTMCGVFQHLMQHTGWLLRAAEAFEASQTSLLTTYYGSADANVQIISAMRRSMLLGIQHRDNEPKNLSAIFKTNTLILDALRHRDLRNYLSFAFAVQSFAAGLSPGDKSVGKRTLLHFSALHKLVAALLAHAAEVFDAEELREYVHSVLEGRKEAGEDCELLVWQEGELSTAEKASFGSSSASGAVVVSMLFEREETASKLMSCEAIKTHCDAHEDLVIDANDDDHLDVGQQTKKKKKRRRRNHKKNANTGENADDTDRVGVRDIKIALYSDVLDEEVPSPSAAISFEDAAALSLCGGPLGDLPALLEDLTSTGGGAFRTPSSAEADAAQANAGASEPSLFGDEDVVSLTQATRADDGAGQFLTHLSPLSTLNLQFPSHAFAV